MHFLDTDISPQPIFRTFSGVFIVNFEYISHIVLGVSTIDLTQVYAGWVNF